MARITIKVEPKSGNNIGWDAYCTSWKPAQSALTIHKLTWSANADGSFEGKSADLPAGVYAIVASVIGVSQKASFTVVGEPPVLDPADSEWPMVIEVDGAIETQTTRVWYFQH